MMRLRSYFITASVSLIFSSIVNAQDPIQNSQAPTIETPEFTLAFNDFFDNIIEASSPQEKDLAAILAMQGEYLVTFDFIETVILTDDYTRSPEQLSGGNETVIVVEQTPEYVSLQHILVVTGGSVVKHWRQDWFYEEEERFEFTEERTWSTLPIPEERRSGHWTQCVYEVSDAPRYCGTGRWNHRYGVSTWTSDRTWRPLPRRDATIRDDYNALNVENRHTVTSLGWTHEQDNTKVIRDGEETAGLLVREFGFNDYRRINDFDFSPAYSYWELTSDYWENVRTFWDEHFQQFGKVVINTDIGGTPIIESTFSVANDIANGVISTPSVEEITETLSDWVSGD